ncbi:MAG: ATPase [Syntrophomonadaceae bacterium]|nr:ATPase [Syntrophomonadaceae bacterium]
MKIAVLSGKGGTGKTLLSVNLAAAAMEATYIDCDVEEPNGHLFLKPQYYDQQKINVPIPEVDNQLCNGCRICTDFCQYNALAYINNQLMIFDEMCHSCGGCILFCPEKALREKEKNIGEVRRGMSANVRIFSGIFNTGEASGIPIIKSLLQDTPDGLTFIDCPPGSSCIVMDSIRETDYCIFVAEPSLFGVHNLNMVYELVKLFKKPTGVVLNKCLEGENPAETYCVEKGIKILGRIPFDHELGTLNSNALIAVRESAKYRSLFSALLQNIMEEVQHATAINS